MKGLRGLSVVVLLGFAGSMWAQAPAVPRDGQHDFDFEVGSWKIHLKRLKDRLAGSTTWIDFDGTSVTRKVWDGKGDLEEFETSADSGMHIEGLTLRVYNPTTHQWSLYWANSTDPDLGTPMQPMVGEFDKDGRGEFYQQDRWKGRAVLVRFIWSRPKPTRHTSSSRTPTTAARRGR